MELLPSRRKSVWVEGESDSDDEEDEFLEHHRQLLMNREKPEYSVLVERAMAHFQEMQDEDEELNNLREILGRRKEQYQTRLASRRDSAMCDQLCCCLPDACCVPSSQGTSWHAIATHWKRAGRLRGMNLWRSYHTRQRDLANAWGERQGQIRAFALRFRYMHTPECCHFEAQTAANVATASCAETTAYRGSDSAWCAFPW